MVVMAVMVLCGCRLDAAEVRLKWRAVETDCVGYRVSWGPASGLWTGSQIVPWIYETNCVVEVISDQLSVIGLEAMGPGGLDSGRAEIVWWPRLKLIVDRVDGMDWRPLWTNEVVADRAWEVFRVRVER